MKRITGKRVAGVVAMLIAFVLFNWAYRTAFAIAVIPREMPRFTRIGYDMLDNRTRVDTVLDNSTQVCYAVYTEDFRYAALLGVVSCR